MSFVDGEGHVGIAAAESGINVGKQEGPPLRGVRHRDFPGGLVGDVVDDFIRFFFHINHAVGGGQVNLSRKGGDHGVLFPLKELDAQFFFQAQQLLV